MERFFNQVHVDLGALAHNLGQVRRLVGPVARIMAVVKADAYGHGLIPAGRRLVTAGADALGVMDLEEGTLLREAGITIPIFILAGLALENVDQVAAHDLIPFVYELELVRALSAAGVRAGRRARMALKIDTGMSRLGFPHQDAENILRCAVALPGIEIIGLATHLAEADDLESTFTDQQLDRFESVVNLARNLGLTLTHNSAANSAGLLAYPRAHYQMVRPGIMLYGGCPVARLAGRVDLRPVMSLTSRVIQVKTIAAGQTVSYGRTWAAERPTMLATVPIGYAHGLDRLLSNRGWALIRGRRAPLRGRVCMNLTLFEVTGIPDVAAGDPVTILGCQGAESISGQTLAELTGTIDYEVFCRLGAANHRIFTE